MSTETCTHGRDLHIFCSECYTGMKGAPANPQNDPGDEVCGVECAHGVLLREVCHQCDNSDTFPHSHSGEEVSKSESSPYHIERVYDHGTFSDGEDPRTQAAKLGYRKLSAAEIEAINTVKDMGRSFAGYLGNLSPMPSRELSIAQTKIDEAVMWTVKHIAKKR